MSDKMNEIDFHEKMAKSLFNRTWDLMDKKKRIPEEDVEMIHTVHASAYHWSKIGNPLNFQRGEWQISRVYAVLGFPESCLYHAKRCLDLTEKHNIKDFDLSFAYEAMARAYSIALDADEKEKYIKLAKESSEQIEKKDDKAYLLSELDTIE